MSNYKSQRVLAAPPAAVYAALTTAKGLQGWWTHSCDVTTHVGGKTTFRFGRTHKVLQTSSWCPTAKCSGIASRPTSRFRV